MDKKDSKNIIYVNGKPVDPDKDGHDIFNSAPPSKKNPYRHVEYSGGGKKISSPGFREINYSMPEHKGSKKGRAGRIVFTVILVTVCAIVITIVGIIFASRHTSEVSDTNITSEEDSKNQKAKTMSADGTTPDSPYTAPEELGENLSDGRIQLDGQNYQFPIPYSVLAKDGWTFYKPEYSSKDVVTDQTKIKSHDTSYNCYLKKDDSPELYVQVTNFSSTKALASECAITSISLYMPYEEAQKPWIRSAATSADLSFSVPLADFEQMMKAPEIKKLEIGQDIYIDTNTTDEGTTYKHISIYFPERDVEGDVELRTSVNVSFRDTEMDSLSYSVDPYFSSY